MCRRELQWDKTVVLHEEYVELDMDEDKGTAGEVGATDRFKVWVRLQQG